MGIDEICQETEKFNAKKVARLFGKLSPSSISRLGNRVDLLVGNNHAPLHPVRKDYCGNLVLYASEFGTGSIVGGEHELIKGTDKLNAFTQIVARAGIQNVRIYKPSKAVDFFTAEGLGVQVPPQCKSCKGCKVCKYLNSGISMN